MLQTNAPRLRVKSVSVFGEGHDPELLVHLLRRVFILCPRTLHAQSQVWIEGSQMQISSLSCDAFITIAGQSLASVHTHQYVDRKSVV